MLEQALQWLGFGLCHQLPERSFFGGSFQLPVCARDTGIYLGFVFALIALRLVDRGRRSSEPPPLSSTLILIALIGAMAIDGLTSYSGLRETTNDLRLITGLAAGFGIAGLVYPMLNGQLWRNPGYDRVLGKASEMVGFLIALPLSFLLTKWGLPFLAEGYALLTAVAIVVTFATVNLVLVCLFPPFERKAHRLRDAWLPVLLALALTGVQLALASLLRWQMLKLAGLL